jgi:hypothetical protein
MRMMARAIAISVASISASPGCSSHTTYHRTVTGTLVRVGGQLSLTDCNLPRSTLLTQVDTAICRLVVARSLRSDTHLRCRCHTGWKYSTRATQPLTQTNASTRPSYGRRPEVQYRR